MTITKDRVGGLIFLAVSIAYGYSATSIPMYPGDELEPFTARTLPYVLAVLGGAISLFIVLLSRDGETLNDMPSLNLKLAAGLLLLMVAYGLTLEWLGFFLATSLFLIAGYWVLGERRKSMLFWASFPFAGGFWLILTELLDIYLAPGELMLWLGGI